MHVSSITLAVEFNSAVSLRKPTENNLICYATTAKKKLAYYFQHLRAQALRGLYLPIYCSMFTNANTSWLGVLSGVPQGSVFGPILFSIFVKDLDIRIKNSLLKFADDTKVFDKVSDPADHLLLQDDIKHLIEWSADRQMLFNVDKSKVMHFDRNNQEYVNYTREFRFSNRLVSDRSSCSLYN